MSLVRDMAFWRAAPENHRFATLSQLAFATPVRLISIGEAEDIIIEFKDGELAFATRNSHFGIDLDDMLKEGFIDQEWYDRALILHEEFLEEEGRLIKLQEEKKQQGYYLQALSSMGASIQQAIRSCPDEAEKAKLQAFYDEYQKKYWELKDAFDQKFGARKATGPV